MGVEGLGARLADVIGSERLSQNEFATRLEMSGSFVSDVVRGAKLPGAEFLAQLKLRFGVSIDWLLTGEGSMYGGQPIDLDELRRLAALVDLARKSEIEHNEWARSLVKKIQSLQAPAGQELDLWAQVLSDSSDAAPDRLLAAALYNSHLWTSDRWQRYRNALSAAIAHFQLNRPLKIASLADGGQSKAGGTGPVQNNSGSSVHATMFGSIVGATPQHEVRNKSAPRKRRR